MEKPTSSFRVQSVGRSRVVGSAMRAVLSRDIVVAGSLVTCTKTASGLLTVTSRMAILAKVAGTRDVHSNLLLSKEKGNGKGGAIQVELDQEYLEEDS